MSTNLHGKPMKIYSFLFAVLLLTAPLHGEVEIKNTRLWIGTADLEKVLQVPPRMWTPTPLPLPSGDILRGDFWVTGELHYSKEDYLRTPYLNLGRLNAPLEMYFEQILVLQDGDLAANIQFTQGKHDIVILPPPKEGFYTFHLRVQASEGESLEQKWQMMDRRDLFLVRLLDFMNMDIYRILSLLVAFIGVFFLLQFLFDRNDLKNLFFGLANISFSMYFLLALTPPDFLPGVRSFALGKAFLFPALSFLLLFFLHFFQMGRSRPAYWTLGSTTVILFLVNLLIPKTLQQANEIFSLSLLAGQFLLLAMIILACVAFFKGNKDAPVILSGAVFGVGLGLFDVYHMILGLRPLIWVQGIGIFLFNFSMFVSLAIKNHRNTRQLELSHRIIQGKKKELEQANESLKALDLLKDQFLANTSHELRTPLNGMMGLLEQILDPRSEPLSAEQRRLLDLVWTSAARLERLIRDILDFSLLKNKKMILRPQSTDLSSLISGVADLLRPTIGHKPVEIRLKVDPLPPVWTDGARLEQVLINLVGNALKFTREGWVEIRAQKMETSVRIEVEDTGIGISPENLSRVFDSFQQGNRSIVREFGGTGLGLTISRDLLHLMGSQLVLDSHEGKGTSFRFDLSLDFPDLPPSESSLRDPQSMKDLPVLRILAVDDEPINLEVIRGQLRHTPFLLTKVQSGMEALALLESEVFDAVIMDVMMPIVSGFETVQILRTEKNPVPVVLLTARNASQDTKEGWHHGANGLLEKPSQGKELIQHMLALQEMNGLSPLPPLLGVPATWVSWQYPQSRSLGEALGSDPLALKRLLKSLGDRIASRGGKVVWLQKDRFYLWIPTSGRNAWTLISPVVALELGSALVLQYRTKGASLAGVLDLDRSLDLIRSERNERVLLASAVPEIPQESQPWGHLSAEGVNWYLQSLTVEV